MEQRSALAEMKKLLAEAVNSLPSIYRAVYEMRDLDEVPGDGVAQPLGISRTAMKSRLHR
jgi:DNA-directed RNA polymerase specialized sigma24 family protein